jgi:hypothetical protein
MAQAWSVAELLRAIVEDVYGWNRRAVEKDLLVDGDHPSSAVENPLCGTTADQVEVKT